MSKNVVRIVLLEPGAEPEATFASDSTVITAGEGESPGELARRVLAQIASIEAARGHVARLTLVAGPDTSDATFAARCLIARALVAHLGFSGPGELLLCAGERLNAVAREELVSLAAALAAQVKGSQLNVYLRLGGDTMPPGATPHPGARSPKVAFAHGPYCTSEVRAKKPVGAP